jgi:hypothetical protein
MYRVLNGYDIEPIATEEELRAWRDREATFISLVDRVTRRLSTEHRIYPMALEPQPEPRGYYRRYVCRALGTEYPCFSLGVRDFLLDYTTPIWFRFARTTPSFELIHSRLAASEFSQKLVVSEGNLWLPLEVGLKLDGERLVDELVAQAEEIVRVAYGADSTPG